MKKKYNNWTILKKKIKQIDNKIYVRCRCDCGVEKYVILKNVKSGRSKSCGCIGRKKTTERNYKHGKRQTRTWRIWRAMKTRCYNPNATQYHNYGGREIKVCKEWNEDFMVFYNHFGDIPEGKSIDRIDNDGDYSPENTRLSTPKQQAHNKSNNRKINGVCISEISRSLGGRHSLVAKRIARGWDLQRAITEKTNATKKYTKD